ncbi:MAG: DUF2213 domain-containing protein [Vulcanimicrobiaceae bacterium]
MPVPGPLSTAPNAGIPLAQRRKTPQGDDEAFADVKVDADHDGPWMSCMSKDGTTMYRNRNVPAEAEINGKTVDVDQRLKRHEVSEWRLLRKISDDFKQANSREPNDQERKALYQTAHRKGGVPAEDALVNEEDGGTKAWNAWCRGIEAKIENGSFTNPPADADVKPMPHRHDDLEATLDETVAEYQSGIPSWGEMEGQNTRGAADSALSFAFDRGSVRRFDEVGRMFVPGVNISKAQIRPYAGWEIPGWDDETKTHKLGLDPNKIYRMCCPPDELEKAAPTFNGIQLLKEHVPVDADDHQKEEIIGTTWSDCRFEHPYLKVGLSVWTQEGIDLIESEKQRQISSGYQYDPDMTPGVFEGEEFDGVMRNLRGNHCIVCEEGRAGPDVVVPDSVIELQWQAIESALRYAWAA